MPADPKYAIGVYTIYYQKSVFIEITDIRESCALELKMNPNLVSFTLGARWIVHIAMLHLGI